MTPYDHELAIKITIAAILGAVIGFERQKNQKPAGVRTQMLICIGSALLAGLSIDIAAQHAIAGSLVRPDPTRLMAQIVAGIGFIGGGVILKGNDGISGVTTAATVWLTAAIGIAVGSGFFFVAAFCVMLVVATYPLTFIKHRAVAQRVTYILSVPRKRQTAVERILEKKHAKYQLISINPTNCELRVFSYQGAKESVVHELDARKIEFRVEGAF